MGSRAKRWRSCGARSSAAVTEAFSRSPSEMARRRPACACEHLQLARSKPSRPVRSSGAMVPSEFDQNTPLLSPVALHVLTTQTYFCLDAIDCRPTVSRETSHMAIGRNPAMPASCAAAPVIDPATPLLSTHACPAARASPDTKRQSEFTYRSSANRVPRVGAMDATQRSEPTPAATTVVLTVDLKTLSWFLLSALRPSNRYLCKSISERSNQMRIRTIAAAFVVAAPLLALGSPQAAACWETGYRYGYSYGYSSPTMAATTVASASAGLATGAVGWRRGYGYRGGWQLAGWV